MENRRLLQKVVGHLLIVTLLVVFPIQHSAHSRYQPFRPMHSGLTHAGLECGPRRENLHPSAIHRQRRYSFRRLFLTAKYTVDGPTVEPRWSLKTGI